VCDKLLEGWSLYGRPPSTLIASLRGWGRLQRICLRAPCNILLLLPLLLHTRETHMLQKLHDVLLAHSDDWRQLVALPPVLSACCCIRFYHSMVACSNDRHNSKTQSQ
jgi:hypothetical protein